MNQAITAGSEVRIVYGKLRGHRGEVVKVEGGVYTVAHSSGCDTFRLRELEAV